MATRRGRGGGKVQSAARTTRPSPSGTSSPSWSRWYASPGGSPSAVALAASTRRLPAFSVTTKAKQSTAGVWRIGVAVTTRAPSSTIVDDAPPSTCSAARYSTAGWLRGLSGRGGGRRSVDGSSVTMHLLPDFGGANREIDSVVDRYSCKPSGP